MTTIKTLTPMLRAMNLTETIDFYKTLGFERTGRWPDTGRAVWASLKFGDASIMFYTDDSEKHITNCSGTMYFYCEGVREYFEKIRDKVKIAHEPNKTHYEMYEFVVKDPNGYFLTFAEPACIVEKATADR